MIGVPKTTETRWKDDNVYVLKTGYARTTQITLFLHPFFYLLQAMLWDYWSTVCVQWSWWNYLCSLCMPCLVCTLPYLVSVVFRTTISTSLYIFRKWFVSVLVQWYTEEVLECISCKFQNNKTINDQNSPCSPHHFHQWWRYGELRGAWTLSWEGGAEPLLS